MEYGKTHMLIAEDGAYLVKPRELRGDFFTRELISDVVNPDPDVGKAWPGGKPKRKTYGIRRVIFNDPATIVYWLDDTKTVVKCQPGDVYSKETGLALCIAKKFLGNKGNFNDIFKQWISEEVEISVEKMRKELKIFCDKKYVCFSCPLSSPVCRCGCGTHFLSKRGDGSYDMSDDEIRDAYAVAFKRK